MRPEPGDVVVVGKSGLSAFNNTSLEAELMAHGAYQYIRLGNNYCAECSRRAFIDSARCGVRYFVCDLPGVETLALAGFMANCCVESTMREVLTHFTRRSDHIHD
jgi:nicotinamidase-related amidase